MTQESYILRYIRWNLKKAEWTPKHGQLDQQKETYCLSDLVDWLFFLDKIFVQIYLNLRWSGIKVVVSSPTFLQEMLCIDTKLFNKICMPKSTASLDWPPSILFDSKSCVAPRANTKNMSCV